MRCRNINPITITWVVAWMLIATMSASAGIRSTFPKMKGFLLWRISEASQY
jgi:hypothetical protein